MPRPGVVLDGLVLHHGCVLRCEEIADMAQPVEMIAEHLMTTSSGTAIRAPTNPTATTEGNGDEDRHGVDPSACQPPSVSTKLAFDDVAQQHEGRRRSA